MTKQELIDAVHAHAADRGITITKKATDAIVDDIFDIAASTIEKEGGFSYPGFGTFTKKHRKGREGRNPQNGAPLQIAASNTVGFKAAPKLKERVN